MTKDEVFLRLKDILTREFEIDADSITADAKLYDDLELDSIDAIDLLVKMKEYLKEKVDPELFKKALTVQDVVDILHPLVK
jgi:acyl carrier protein